MVALNVQQRYEPYTAVNGPSQLPTAGSCQLQISSSGHVQQLYSSLQLRQPQPQKGAAGWQTEVGQNLMTEAG
jgi:hypothetical protein